MFTTLDTIHSSSVDTSQHEYFELYFPSDFTFPSKLHRTDAFHISFFVKHHFYKQQKVRYQIIQKDSMNEVVLVEDDITADPKQELRKEITLQNFHSCDRCAIKIVLPEHNVSIHFWTSIL